MSGQVSCPDAVAASISSVSFSYAIGERIRWYKIEEMAAAVVSEPAKLLEGEFSTKVLISRGYSSSLRPTVQRRPLL
jgi:hypothetical protein